MSASEKQHQLVDTWQNDLSRIQATPDSGTASWLNEAGLLTRRLRECCGDDFNLRVLRDTPVEHTHTLQREVLLCCNQQPCIYAITEIPAITLQQHRWLAELGDEPLGETLQTRGDVSRSDFVYAFLAPHKLPPAAGDQRDSVWARRSEFHIGAAMLTVTEIFLPALQNCDQPLTHRPLTNRP